MAGKTGAPMLAHYGRIEEPKDVADMYPSSPAISRAHNRTRRSA
jgi:hypothetical protein